MLSWMRWLTSWFWSITNSTGNTGGFLGWFGENWKSLAVTLIIAGVIIDWIIWMIRWRPYWIWTRKRQIIYEEVPERRKKRRPAPVNEESLPEEEDFDDPFSEAEEADPYTRKAASPEDDMAEWDSGEDPYAQAGDESGEKTPHYYGRPKLGSKRTKSR